MSGYEFVKFIEGHIRNALRGISLDYFDQGHYSFKKNLIKPIVINSIVKLIKNDAIIAQ